MTVKYVYGLVGAGAELPAGLTGLQPAGGVSTVEFEQIAAIVSDVPADRPLGTRDDLMAHEQVLDTVALQSTVLPMRFAAVIDEASVVPELLAPHQERFLKTLTRLDGSVQFTLKGRYEHDTVLREIVAADARIRALDARVRELPEDASYYDRIRLGELVVKAFESLREADARQVLERLQRFVTDVSVRPPAEPDVVVNAAFLVNRNRVENFDDAVEEIGRDFAGRVRFRLVGPLAPYDFASEGE